MLGYQISRKEMEVDQEKIETIEKLLPPTSVKGIRSSLGHVRFHKRFIRDFSKISKPLSSLLLEGAPFNFDENFMCVFSTLKEKLISTPIIVALDKELVTF